jgi:hypothetical protein
MPEYSKPLIDENKIIKEVFNKQDVDAKTDLNYTQVEVVSKGLTLAELFGSPILHDHLSEFMVLQKSLERKSLGEFVESLRSKKEDMIKNSKNFALFG